jgi:hypothetical protein
MPKLDEKIPADFRALVATRLRKELIDLDYKREILVLSKDHSQRELAKWLGIAQPSINAVLQRAKKNLALVPEGFSGASPYEICQRYAADEITRVQLVDQLTRWQYVPGNSTDGYDDLIVDPPGTFREVEAAYRHGLIDGDLYDEVFDAVADD